MPTQCSRDLFGHEVVEGRQVVAAFDGGEVTSDAGGLLLGATDRAIGLIGRFAACFNDGRAPAQVEHAIETMVAQRVFGIALGYEDVVDHDQLRFDPVLATLAGKLTARRKNCAPLAGKSTLNRLEHAPAEAARYHKIGHDGDRTAVRRPGPRGAQGAAQGDHPRPRRHGIARSSGVGAPLPNLSGQSLHGRQEGRFFHGYYDCYCYLPLYVFCGRHLLAAKLRRSNIDASAGAIDEVARLIGQLRARWPRVRILLRADSGFARDELMAWCEANSVDYVFGLARHQRLVGAIAEELAGAVAESLARGGAARRFADFAWRTLDSWSRTRRVVAKAEHLPKGANPGFVVTSLPGERHRRAHPVRGRLLRPRRGREPDQGLPGSQGRPWWSPRSGKQLDLFAERTSAATMRANQLRLWFASFAYVLLEALRRIGLRHTQFGQCHLRHDPAQAPENRRPGSQERAPDQGRHGLGLPVPGRVTSATSTCAAPPVV